MEENIKFNYKKKYNLKKNLTINVNEGNKKSKKTFNKHLLSTDLINKEYINNSTPKQEMLKNRIRAINNKNTIDTGFINKIEKSISNYNINRSECLRGKQRKILSLNKVQFPSFMRVPEELYLPNNIHYKSQLFKIKKYLNYNSLIPQNTNRGNLLYKNYICSKK